MHAAILAADIPYWGQSLLRVLGVLVAVLIPAGTIVLIASVVPQPISSAITPGHSAFRTSCPLQAALG